ncbi:Os07g0533400 [Oryza sativa Japonica Group]|uniref:Os07g0533400 protein n=1 Tax=Oryza sativa subsp. japonica TaxID=39947 RepID=A0A0N7KNK8_ORYSJ|nr:Os07g0533400 [Oryza sativa Japonica Group]
MELAVGTPPVTVQALFGISDLCWVECTPCSGCNNNAAPPAGARLYDRANSSSFSPLACASQACKVLPDRAGPHDVQRHRVRVPVRVRRHRHRPQLRQRDTGHRDHQVRQQRCSYRAELHFRVHQHGLPQ